MNSHTRVGREYYALFLYIGICLCAFGRADRLDEVWANGLTAFQREDYSASTRHWNEWIEVASEQGIRSAHVYENLSLAHWKLKQDGKAIYSLLQANRWLHSPLKIAKNFRKVTALERERGIKDPVSNSLRFQLPYYLGENSILFSMTIIFWLSVLMVMSYFFGRPLWQRHKYLLGSAWVLIIFSLCGYYALLSVQPHYGVLAFESNKIPLSRLPTAKKSDLLIRLPGGTVVVLGATKESQVKIVRPFSGWVPKESVLVLNPSLRGWDRKS